MSTDLKLQHLGSAVYDLAVAVSELRIAVMAITQDPAIQASNKQEASKSLGEVFKRLDDFLKDLDKFRQEPPSA